MQRKIIYALLLLTAGFAAPACSTDETAAAGGTGYLKMNISTTRVGDDSDPASEYDPMEHLVVRIYNADGGLIRKYTSRELVPETLELLAGSYSVAVEAGEAVPASFTQRFYKGGQPFDITAGGSTPVEVRCTIQNTVAEVTFDPTVEENFGENFHVWVAAGTEVDETAAESGEQAALKYTADGTGYFTLPEGTDHLAWRFAGTHASRGEIVQEGSVEAKAGTKYALQFSYSKNRPGYVDCTVMSIKIEDPDEFDDTIVFTPDPQLEGVGFNVATPQNYIPGKSSGISYKITTTYPIQTARFSVGGQTVNLLQGETPATGVTVVKEEEKALTVTLSDEFIAAFGGGEQTLTFHVEDNNGGTLDATPKLRIHGLVAVKTSDCDLWSNTVTLRALVVDPEVGNVRFGLREKDGSWREVEGTPAANNYYTATFAPEWSDATDPDRPADGGSYPAIYRQTEGTGIFAAHEYEYRADLGGVQQSGSFTTASGDAIYNSGMEYWSTYTVKGGSLTSAEVPYPNEAASKVFWTSGNNKQTNALCTGQAIEGNNGSLCAALQPKATMGVFAAGNLFTGIFECGSGFSTSGYARFGTQYTYSARPRALRVRVNATVTQVTNAKGPLTTDDIDPARVYVCITNWTDRHTVESGLQYNESTFWDPAKASSLAEGAIIGYGSKTFTESTDGWTTLTLPIYWYDKTAAPAAGRYSLVISCSTSAYGDYTTGSTNNRLYVEDFEWVY